MSKFNLEELKNKSWKDLTEEEKSFIENDVNSKVGDINERIERARELWQGDSTDHKLARSIIEAAALMMNVGVNATVDSLKNEERFRQTVIGRIIFELYAQDSSGLMDSVRILIGIGEQIEAAAVRMAARDSAVKN